MIKKNGLITLLAILLILISNCNNNNDNITDSGSEKNHKPVAYAGDDQAVAVGDTVQLDASGSSDEDGDSLAYRWSIQSTPDGSTAKLSDTTTVNPTFVADKLGNHTIQLIVNDQQEDSHPDTVNVSANNLTASFTVSPANVKPYYEVYFDASQSSDSLFTLDELQVRWDWEDDGIFDTEYSSQKIDTNRFSSSGEKTIRLQVRNPNGYESSTTNQVNIKPYDTCFSRYKDATGTYIWRRNIPKMFSDFSEIECLLDWCVAKGVTELYLDVNYLDDYENEIRDFIKVCHEASIEVQALMGDPRWSLTPFHSDAEDSIQKIITYNNNGTVNERFDAIHFDVEPWTLDGQNIPGDSQWVENPLEVSIQFLTMLSECQDLINRSGQDLKFIEDITFWFDDTEDYPEIDSIPWNSKTQSLDHHIIDIVDMVAIMTVTKDAEWIKVRVDTELQYANNQGKPIMIIFEAGEFGSIDDLNNCISNVALYFDSISSFVGPAIHSYFGWISLH